MRSATSINTDVFGCANKIGRIKKSFVADIVMADGDPSADVSVLRKIVFIMKDGKIYKEEK